MSSRLVLLLMYIIKIVSSDVRPNYCTVTQVGLVTQDPGLDWLPRVGLVTQGWIGYPGLDWLPRVGLVTQGWIGYPGLDFDLVMRIWKNKRPDVKLSGIITDVYYNQNCFIVTCRL